MIGGEWIGEVTPDMLPGIYRRMAEEIGAIPTLKVADLVQGTSSHYFPKLDDLMAELRNRQIRAEFNGRNHRHLALKYGLTERWIYEIVSPVKNAVDENQVSLFEDEEE